MTTIADLNNKWASCGGPSVWNGKQFISRSHTTSYTLSHYVLMTIVTIDIRSGYVGSWEWMDDLRGVPWSFQHLGFDEGM